MSRLSTDGRTDGQRNVKIELEFWKQNLQYTAAMGTVDIRLLLAFDLQFHCNLASALFGFDPKSNIKGRQNEEIKCRILVKKGKVKFMSAVHLPICNQFD